MSTKRSVGPVNLTADGTTESIELGDSGRGVFMAQGDFGTPGGTVALQVRLPDGNFATSTEVTQGLTADGEIAFVLCPGVPCRLVLAGATSPNLNVQLITG